MKPFWALHVSLQFKAKLKTRTLVSPVDWFAFSLSQHCKPLISISLNVSYVQSNTAGLLKLKIKATCLSVFLCSCM